MGGGSAFADVKNPRVMVQCGARGSDGVLEITDVVFTTRGPGGLFDGRVLSVVVLIVLCAMQLRVRLW